MPDELSDCCVLQSIIYLPVTAAAYGLEPSNLGCEASVELLCYPRLQKLDLKSELNIHVLFLYVVYIKKSNSLFCNI